MKNELEKKVNDLKEDILRSTPGPDTRSHVDAACQELYLFHVDLSHRFYYATEANRIKSFLWNHLSQETQTWAKSANTYCIGADSIVDEYDSRGTTPILTLFFGSMPAEQVYEDLFCVAKEFFASYRVKPHHGGKNIWVQVKGYRVEKAIRANVFADIRQPIRSVAVPEEPATQDGITDHE